MTSLNTMTLSARLETAPKHKTARIHWPNRCRSGNQRDRWANDGLNSLAGISGLARHWAREYTRKPRVAGNMGRKVDTNATFEIPPEWGDGILQHGLMRPHGRDSSAQDNARTTPGHALRKTTV